MNIQEKINLYKVRNNVIEMIRDRKYDVSNEFDISLEEFIIKYDNKNIDLFIDNPDKQRIYVHFIIDNKTFSKGDLKTITENIITKHNDSNMKIIYLLKDKENSIIAKEINKPMYQNIELFIQKYMIFNITKHILVPKHTILSKEEEDQLLENYNTTKGQLPKLLRTDPIARYYNMQLGQICKIMRKSPSTGDTAYYRVVK